MNMTTEQARLYVYKKLQYHMDHEEKMSLDEFLKASEQIKNDVLNNIYVEEISEQKLNELIEQCRIL